MKSADIKSLSANDLKDKLSEETQLLSKLKLGHAVSPIENPMKIRVARRNIAKLKTELHTRK